MTQYWLMRIYAGTNSQQDLANLNTTRFGSELTDTQTRQEKSRTTAETLCTRESNTEKLIRSSTDIPQLINQALADRRELTKLAQACNFQTTEFANDELLKVYSPKHFTMLTKSNELITVKQDGKIASIRFYSPTDSYLIDLKISYDSESDTITVDIPVAPSTNKFAIETDRLKFCKPDKLEELTRTIINDLKLNNFDRIKFRFNRVGIDFERSKNHERVILSGPHNLSFVRTIGKELRFAA